MFLYGLIDIDNFTSFNLLNSYEKGNATLERLEDIAKNTLHPIKLKKLDGDEFIFIMLGSFEENKQNVSNLLLDCKFYLEVSVSVGLCELNTICDFKQIINQLRVNLLIAKNCGKNKMCLT